MSEGWSIPRVITILLLVALLFASWHVLRSLDHQQAQIVELADKVSQLRGVSVGTVDPEAAETPAASAGKDAIGRPLRATPGFTLYPPPGKEIPGRTIARKPEKVREVCGTYVQGEASEPDKINSYLTNSGLTRRQIDPQVHERLINVNPDDPTELWPELAVAWEVGDDHLTYLFHLRKGVEFSDGTPFDADDVLFSYNTIMDPSVESESVKAYFLDVEGVRKLDSHTVEVRMRKPYWKALRAFGYQLQVQPREYYEREIPRMAKDQGIKEFSVVPGEPGFGAVFNTFTREMSPGTGQYMWHEGESWVTNQYIDLFPHMNAWVRKLNPDHYRIEKLRWRIVGDQVARQEEFRKGGIDVLVVDHNVWEDKFSKDPTIADISNHYVYDHIGNLYSYIWFNCRRFPFDDVNVRRAVAHLTDRERLVKDVERGNAKVATCVTKRIYPEYSLDLVPHAYDPKRAAEILTAAGWIDTDGDGIRDKDGRALEFTLAVPSGRVFFTTLTTLMQEACRSVGVRLRAEPKEFALCMEDLYKLNFDSICLYASASDPWIDPFDEHHSSQCAPMQGNRGGWKNAEVDALVEAMRREFDDEKRAQMFHRFNAIFHDELPRLLLLHGDVGVCLNKRIQGAKIRRVGLRDFDMWIDPK